MIDAYLKGRPVNLSVGFRDALKNADGLLSLALINIAIGWLTSLAESRSSGSLIRCVRSSGACHNCFRHQLFRHDRLPHLPLPLGC